MAREPQSRAGRAAAGAVALRRGDGPCRHVPGRRARSRLARSPRGSTSGARWRRSTSSRRWRSSTRSTSSSSGADSRCEQASVAGGGTAPALPSLHAVPLCAASGRLALSRAERPRRVLRRRRSAHRMRGARLLALASSARRAGIDGDAGAAADGVPHPHRRGCRRPARAAVRARSRRLDAPVGLPCMPAIRRRRAGRERRRDPLRVGARSAAWRMLRGAHMARVRETAPVD